MTGQSNASSKDRRPALPAETVFRLAWATNHLMSEIDRSIEDALHQDRILDLSAVHARVMIGVAMCPGGQASVTELESPVGASCRKGIAALLEKGYLTAMPSPFDRRALVLTTTKSGSAAVDCIMKALATPSARLKLHARDIRADAEIIAAQKPGDRDRIG